MSSTTTTTTAYPGTICVEDAQGWFSDGDGCNVELGEYVFATPSDIRLNFALTPHSIGAEVLDAGGGLLEIRVTGQRRRANLGDAERYAYEIFADLALSAPGTLTIQDNRGGVARFYNVVCVSAVAEIEPPSAPTPLVTMHMMFQGPEHSLATTTTTIGALSPPEPPGIYPGTSTFMDYAADGVRIGPDPTHMRITMNRSYPLREIPRARGGRSRGPEYGALIVFAVDAHAAITDRHLADYLERLTRRIGPRAVTLSANGNNYPGVIFERTWVQHTDRYHTGFVAEFAQEV